MFDDVKLVFVGMGVALLLIFLIILLSRSNGGGGNGGQGPNIDPPLARKERHQVPKQRGKSKGKKRKSDDEKGMRKMVTSR